MKNLCFILIIFLSVGYYNLYSQNYKINAQVVVSGGSSIQNNKNIVKSTIAQTIIGPKKGNSFTTNLGFWYLIPKEQNIQSIPLAQGWNLISTYIQPQIPDSMNNVMIEISNNLLIAKNNGGQVFIPSYDINTIGRWNVTQGYLVYMSAKDTLTILGNEVVPTETPIPLTSGWNMIAYLSNSEVSAELAFASITDNNNLLIAKTLDGRVYIPSYNINTIVNMQPGVGYRVYVTTADTLMYPNN